MYSAFHIQFCKMNLSSKDCSCPSLAFDLYFNPACVLFQKFRLPKLLPILPNVMTCSHCASLKGKFLAVLIKNAETEYSQKWLVLSNRKISGSSHICFSSLNIIAMHWWILIFIACYLSSCDDYDKPFAWLWYYSLLFSHFKPGKKLKNLPWEWGKMYKKGNKQLPKFCLAVKSL